MNLEDGGPPCVACGTCCFSELQNYVNVTGDDHARMGDDVDVHTLFDGTHAYMRMQDGHCAALRISGGEHAFTCSIYATRPETCRRLDRGSGACEGEIDTKRARPLLALHRLKR